MFIQYLRNKSVIKIAISLFLFVFLLVHTSFSFLQIYLMNLLGEQPGPAMATQPLNPKVQAHPTASSCMSQGGGDCSQGKWKPQWLTCGLSNMRRGPSIGNKAHAVSKRDDSFAWDVTCFHNEKKRAEP